MVNLWLRTLYSIAYVIDMYSIKYIIYENAVFYSIYSVAKQETSCSALYFIDGTMAYICYDEVLGMGVQHRKITLWP